MRTSICQGASSLSSTVNRTARARARPRLACLLPMARGAERADTVSRQPVGKRSTMLDPAGAEVHRPAMWKALVERIVTYGVIAITSGATTAVVYISAVHMRAGDSLAGDSLGAIATICGAAGALGAAWVAVSPVRKQLAEMRKQSAATAHPALRESAKVLESEVDLLEGTWKVVSRCRSIAVDLKFASPEEEWFSRVLPRAKEAVELALDVRWDARRNSDRNPEVSPLNSARSTFSDTSFKLTVSTSITQGYLARSYALFKSEGIFEYESQYSKDVRIGLEKSYLDFERARSVLRELLKPELALIWRKVNDLERRAAG